MQFQYTAILGGNKLIQISGVRNKVDRHRKWIQFHQIISKDKSRRLALCQ